MAFFFREPFWLERVLSVFKYLLAVFVILVGIGQSLISVEPVHGPLGLLYSSRAFIVSIGVIIALSGCSLLYGKIRRSKKWVGKGLFGIYITFLFATLCQGVMYSWDPSAFVANLIFCIITGLLWLRWKFKTEYIDPQHFKREIAQL